jgi:hypothetical protein
MKKFFFKLFLLAIVLFINKAGFSQTIINYETWTGASGCNIFSSSTNVPATVNGSNTTIAHLTAIGQPTYDNVNKSVNIDSRINGSQNEGAEYRTTTTFKQGFSYVITITAARIMSTQTGPNVLLRIDMNNGGSGNNTTCNGTGIIDASGSGGLKQSRPIGSNSFSDYVFNYTALSAQQAYMMVAAIPPAASVPQTILIRKIKIEETPPSASFTLSPSSLTIPCGSTTAQTFTVTNVNNTPNVTNHLWNLGATPNGWLLPNGSAAPATYSTGLTNTLTLTPVCGSVQKNVSAIVTANATAYNTNTSTVSISQPAMSINGSSTICTSGAYLIAGLPSCNASVVWSASPTGIVTPNTSTSATPTFTKVANGNITLSATVTSCGVVQPALTKTIRVGGYTSSDYPITGPSSATCGTIVSYSAPQLTGATNYIWTYPGSPWTYLGGQGTRTLTMRTPTFSSGGSFNVKVNNACGAATSSSSKITVVTCILALTDTYEISPNPATNSITVSTSQNKSATSTNTSFDEIRVFDFQGNLKKYQQYNKVNQATINISDLTNGTYLIEITNGTYKEKQQLIIQK